MPFNHDELNPPKVLPKPMKPNVLMCTDVCVLLPPQHQAYLRCAGRVGYNAFEELVDRSEIPTYVDVCVENNFSEDNKAGDTRFWEGAFAISTMRAPLPHSFNYKAPKTPKQAKLESRHIITFSQHAFIHRGLAAIQIEHQQHLSTSAPVPFGTATSSLHHHGIEHRGRI